MRCIIVIPARMGSTRFPGKPLCDLLGKPMVQWVYEAATKSGVGEKVVVAFDKPVTVAVDGEAQKVTVHDDTVGDVLDRLDVKPTPKAYVSGKRSERLSRSGTRIIISNPKSRISTKYGMSMAILG